jgi:GNAT superfamily N-acetyltransferase
MVPIARRAESEAELVTVHDLLVEAFAYMDGRIDPRSSMANLTVADLLGGPGEVWVVGDPLVACVVLTPTDESLYIGKLAVRGSERGSGLARVLINHAECRAQQLGLPILELQTRIELTENQRTFETMGFLEYERTAHAGFSRPTSITYRKPVV